MTKEQSAAFVAAASARVFCRAMAMDVENATRKMNGEAPAYREQHFLDVIDEEGISHNAVLNTFQNAG